MQEGNDQICAFSERLNQVLSERGLPKKEFASLLGVLPGSISRYSKGRHLPGSEELMKMAKILNVSMDWLMGLDASQKIINYANCENKLSSEDHIGISVPRGTLIPKGSLNDASSRNSPRVLQEEQCSYGGSPSCVSRETHGEEVLTLPQSLLDRLDARAEDYGLDRLSTLKMVVKKGLDKFDELDRNGAMHDLLEQAQNLGAAILEKNAEGIQSGKNVG